MWPRYEVVDEFLYPGHFIAIKECRFLTAPNEWDIYKHKIYPDGKIDIGFQSSTPGKQPIKPLEKDRIRELNMAYHQKMMRMLRLLAPEKEQYYKYTELNVVNNGKDFTFPIHSDSRDKLLSVVIYIAPKINEGTWLYDDKSGTNPRQIEWKQNRAFGFSRNDNTWHSYKADGKSNRLALVYNLRSDKYWKK